METIAIIQNLVFDHLDKQKKELLYALFRNAGNISDATEALGLCRQTHYNYKKDEIYKKAVEDIHERNLDIAESMLNKKIREGDITAIIFFLKTQGRKRGYGDRTEFTGVDGTPLFQIICENKEDILQLEAVNANKQ